MSDNGERDGQQLGNYRLTQLLGRGNFADVYRGQHVHLNTQAAIKVMHSQLVREDLENFLREARTVASLKHPNITQLLDFPEHTAAGRMTTEFIAVPETAFVSDAIEALKTFEGSREALATIYLVDGRQHLLGAVPEGEVCTEDDLGERNYLRQCGQRHRMGRLGNVVKKPLKLVR